MNSEKAALKSVSLHSIYQDLLTAVEETLVPHNAKPFSNISNEIPSDIPEIQIRGNDVRTFVLLMLLTSIQNSREGTAITLNAKANNYTVDLSLTFTPNPMFVLLTKGTRESFEKDIEISTLLNASDPYVTFHLARAYGMRQHVNLWVETIPPDKAVIHAYFPLNMPAVPEAGKLPTILVIEDNRQISMLLELYLKHEGYKTIAAINGVEGITMAEEMKPDLITLDVMMPEMDGWQALRELKTNEATKNIPITVISVLRDVQVGFEFGASDYLTKPVNRNDLINSTNRLIAPYRDFTPLKAGSPNALRMFSSDELALAIAKERTGAGSLYHAKTSSALVDTQIAAGQNVPDAFIVDTRESIISGLSAACRVRLHPALEDTPILAVATQGQSSLFQRFAPSIIAGAITLS
jgi:CheY-like chemotaxis protein